MKQPFLIVCLFLVALGVSGCLTQRRAAIKLERIQAKYPELFERDSSSVTRDTAWREILKTIYIDGEEIDTSFVTLLGSVIDSFEVERGRLYSKIRVLESRELGTKTVEVYIRSNPDTIRDTIRVPEIRTVEKRVPAPCEVISSDGWPWWLILIAAVVSGAATYFGARVRKQR